MMPNIKTSVESRRGCGYRKEGGFYLTSNGLPIPCGKLPIPLAVCPTCNCGIHPARGWSWVDGDTLANRPCTASQIVCNICPLSKPLGKVGLLWVGEKFYSTPLEFRREAGKMGISRRIAMIPHKFKLGETWVFLAHRKAIANVDGTFTPAVFQVFKPEAIEYIVKDTDSDEKLERLEKRGFTLVKVVRSEPAPLLEQSAPETTEVKA